LMDLLGLSEDELCETLGVDPLTLLSGQLDHRRELPILLTLLDEASEKVAPAGLRLRRGPPGRGRGGWVSRSPTGCGSATPSATRRESCSTRSIWPTSTTRSPSCGARRTGATSGCSSGASTSSSP